MFRSHDNYSGAKSTRITDKVSVGKSMTRSDRDMFLHDFKNLKFAFDAAVEMLEKKEKDSLSGDQFWQIIKQSGRKMKDYIEQLLQIDFFDRPARMINLNDRLQEQQALLAGYVNARISLKLNLARDLKPVMIRCNDFERLLMNLVINARDAMPNGGEVHISTANVKLSELEAKKYQLKVGQYVQLTIRDTGCGIPPKCLSIIFKHRFTTKDKSEHSGLGLAIVRNIMEQLGGGITVTSEVGRGTTFNLYFPQAEVSLDKNEDTQEIRFDFEEEEVLIVYGSLEIRNKLITILKRAGYGVTSAASIDEALEYLENPKNVFAALAIGDNFDEADIVLLQEKRPELLIKKISNSGLMDLSFETVDIKPYCQRNPFSALEYLSVVEESFLDSR